MDSTNTVCPVCTLFLRPGITLKQHLSSHPKQKVIEALVKLAGVVDTQKESNTTSQSEVPASNSQVNAAVLNQPWNPPLSGQLGTHASGQLGTNPSGQMGINPSGQMGPNPNVQPIPGNHVFIYQQSMSTTSPQANVLNVDPLSQQYVYPTVFNPQMMPYVYQQQQVIMSSNSLPPNIRALPFELPGTSQTNNAETTVQTTMETEAEANETIIKSHENNNNVEDEISNEDIQTKGTHQNSETGVKKQEIITLVEEVKTMEDFEIQQENFNDIPPEVFPSESEEEFDHDHEEPASSPSPQNNSDWRFHSELNKACQTQNTNNTPPRPQVIEEEEAMLQNSQYTEEDSPEDQPDYFYVEQPVHQYPEQRNCYSESTNVPFTTVKMNESYEQSEPIYTSANILHGGDHLDFVNMDDIVIIGDFTTNQMISQVENFENTSPDRNRVLMTIGDIGEQSKNDFNDQRDLEESMSRSSSHVNIRSDERMPARGELSGQESIGGASDITWNRLQYQEGSSRMSHSYDLIGRDSWDVSDSDSIDTANVPKRDSSELYQENYVDNELDTPTIVSYTGPPLNFKCATCGESFANSKERKEHELEKHPEKSKKSSIGSEIGKKKVKKLVVKMKSDKPEVEKNSDNVFTNKLKLETSVENELVVTEQTEIKVDETPTTVTLDAISTIKNSVKTVCSICDCVLENTKALKEHKLEVHNETYRLKNKCSTCNESFTNEYKFTEHLKVHPLECRLCGKLFYRRQNIQLHMKRHLGLKPYKCDICQKCFVTRQKHDEHRNVHTGDTPIKCNMCDEKFRRHSNLVQHRNRHHFQIKKKIKDYICQCGEIFHSKKKLAWHKEIHEAKPKACTQCSEKFLHMSSLTRHMRRAHNQQFLPEEKRKNENVECPICKGTYLRSSLEVHIRNHSGQRPYTCLICNKDFTTKWNLKLHKWTHASRTSKPFKCDQCKGAFIRESDYVAHMNSHKSVRPYTCNYCGAQFIRKYNCLRHVKEHENNKNFSCGVCGKTFHRSYYLKDHMRVHSGVRPYTCHICGKTSTTKSNHNKHVQIHHAREPVSTEN